MSKLYWPSKASTRWSLSGRRFTTGKVFPSIGAISAQNVIAETLQHIVVDGQSAADAVKAGQAKMSEIAKK